MKRKVVLTGTKADNGFEYPREEELKNIFASSCVEAAARKEGISPQAMYVRMKAVDSFRQFIYPCYEMLHTQSREIVTEDVLEALANRELHLIQE